MLCENEECGQAAIQKGRHVKSRKPYIATTYYVCEHCGTSFSIESSLGELTIPNDPASILRLVVSKIPLLPKEKLSFISKVIEQMS